MIKCGHKKFKTNGKYVSKNNKIWLSYGSFVNTNNNDLFTKIFDTHGDFL